METAGMIGGIGPESTVTYYRLIVSEYRKARLDGSPPSIFINSINMKKVLDLITANELKEVADYLSGEVEKLAAAGATFGFLAANTPHIVYDEIQKRASIPLISIVKTACEAAKKMGFHRLGLVGPRFTMEGRFYQDIFSPEGIELITPDENDRNCIHDKYMGELVNGIVLPETRERLIGIMEKVQKHKNVEGVILGGTELSLLFQEDIAGGIPLLDTTKIHVAKIVAKLLE